jgi:hypothetical protein
MAPILSTYHGRSTDREIIIAMKYLRVVFKTKINDIVDG